MTTGRIISGSWPAPPLMERVWYNCDDVFFQPDWAGALWGHWAGDRAAVGLVYRLRMWHSSAKTRKKERTGGGFARGRSDA